MREIEYMEMGAVHRKPKSKVQRRKIKVVRMITKAVFVGFCFGFTPMAIVYGSVDWRLWCIPVTPIVIYLITRIIQDLESWWNDEKM